MSSDWPILTKLCCKLLRGCYTQATCLATLRKVEGRSTFLATRNATIAVAKWGVTREFFLATCNATNVASCNMALKVLRKDYQSFSYQKPTHYWRVCEYLIGSCFISNCKQNCPMLPCKCFSTLLSLEEVG